MDPIVVRQARPEDIPGICRVNRGEPGPWADPGSCAAHVLTRMKNGFFIRVAERDGQLVGHAEWIVSDAYAGRSLYLGQLQIEPDLQRQGIGRRMIEDGILRAGQEGCETVTLIPEQETGSQVFYEKCGFLRGKDLFSCSLPAMTGQTGGERRACAPHSVVRELPFVFGLTQTSAEHMWQVFNRERGISGRQVDTLAGGRFCIQLGGFDKRRNAVALAWSDGDVPALIRAARNFAGACGYPGVDFHFYREMRSFFPDDRIRPENYEMVMKIKS